MHNFEIILFIDFKWIRLRIHSHMHLTRIKMGHGNSNKQCASNVMTMN